MVLLNYLRLNRTRKDRRDKRVETSLKVMNACDPHLEAKNGSLALAAMYLFTHCIGTLDQDQQDRIVRDFMTKVKPQVTRFINLKGKTLLSLK